ncbi:MAG: RNA polymerase sigma factor [Planctomycetota bacterium]
MDSPAKPDDSAPSTVQPALPDLTRSMELVRLFQEGDNAALGELLGRYRDRLRRIVRIRMGSRLRSLLEADDLMQDVYLIAVRKLATIEVRDHASILRWLTKVAENQIRDRVSFHDAQRRDQARLASLDAPVQGTGSSPGFEPAGREPSPSQEAIYAEAQEAVDAHVERLQPRAYRRVLLLREYYGYDWETIRRRLDRPTVEAAKELYRRAQVRLRRQIGRSLRPAE